MAIIKKTRDKSWLGYGKRETIVHYWWECKLMENSMEVPQKLKIELPYDPAIPLLGIYLKKTKNTNSKRYVWASLVAQWLGICLLVQGTRVQALVW